MSKKIRFAVLTSILAGVVACSTAFSACALETKHPRALITVEFNQEEYEIEYTLYRNMYPQTVRHFIELSDEGFYDNTIIHNYNAGSDWYGGGYEYDEAEYDKESFGAYLEGYSKEQAYYDLFDAGKLTPSVFSEERSVNEDADAYPTLIGEFGEQHKIEKGALSAEFGTLKMYYYDKGDEGNNEKVNIVNSFDQVLFSDYKQNCATSLFAMQVGSTSSVNSSSYCVFAKLRNSDAEDTLNDLIDAISDYITDELGGATSSFTTSVTTDVDKYDRVVGTGGIEQTFTMTSAPIIIKSVKITKY